MAVVRRLCVSFFVIGIIWVNYHAGLYDIARVDRMAMFITLLLLMFVTAIPFSTAALTSYLHHGGRDGQLAAAIYRLPVLGMALGFTALCAWAARRGMLHATARAAGQLLPFAVSLPGRSRPRPVTRPDRRNLPRFRTSRVAPSP